MFEFKHSLWCHQVPLARSEGNLLELMESVCERMEDYGEGTDPATSRKFYTRIKSRSGEAMDLSEATLDTRVTSSLKFAVSMNFYSPASYKKNETNHHHYVRHDTMFLQWHWMIFLWYPQTSDVNFAAYNFFPLFPKCETIVEQNEDEIIEFFSHETENVKDKLCSKRTGNFWCFLCSCERSYTSVLTNLLPCVLYRPLWPRFENTPWWTLIPSHCCCFSPRLMGRF